MTVVDETRVIGTPMLRREDPALLTGEARYTNDLPIPGALHLAVLRSPYAHARITSVDVSAALEQPGVVAAYSGADLQDQWGAPMPCAWPVTADMKNPPHYPVTVSKACYVGDAVAVVLARSEAEAQDALGAIDVELRAARSRDRPRGRAVRPGRHPRRRGHEQDVHLGAQDRRGGGRRRVRGRRAHREGALHPAAAHPDGHGATCGRRGAGTVRRGDDALLGDADPAHPQDHDGHHPRHPRAPRAGRGPQGRRRLRLEAQRVRRGAAVRGAGQEARRARPLERGPHRERPGHHPGPRADPGHRAGRRRERPADGRPGPAAVRHGCVPAARHPGHPAARRLPLRRRLRHPGGLRLQLHVGVHEHDPDRRLPRRGPARGHLRHRAGHGRAGRQGRAGSDGAAAAQLHPGRAVPLHRLQRAGVRLG